MKNIVIKGLLTGLLCLGAFSNVQASAYRFECLTFNGTGTCDLAEAQMSVDITTSLTASGAAGVRFTFSNVGTDAKATIGEVYFYDGVYINTSVNAEIYNDPGKTNFVLGANPAMLPGYDAAPLTVFAAADVKKNTADGVQAGETLEIVMTLLSGVTYLDVINGVNDGSLVVGIHAKSLGVDGVSESLITTVVPVPAAVWLFGSGLLGLVGVARRRA